MKTWHSLHRRDAILLSVGLLCLSAASTVAAGPVVIAGGALDPAYTGADVYIDTPPPAKVPPGLACKAAKAYVDYHRAGRLADVPTLFAPDAALMEPTRLNIRGMEAITKFYTKAIGSLKPDIAAVFYLGDRTDCMVELAVRHPIDGKARYRLASMDHFTVDASGKIIRMVAFGRPSNLGLKPPHLDE